jgi:hypothetical protein
MPLTILRSKPKTPTLDSLTKLEAEQQSKINAGEEAERLSVLGQESDLKAKKWINEEYKKAAKEGEVAREKAYFNLERLRSNKKRYNKYLAQILIRYLEDEQIPKEYTLKVGWNRKGVDITILKFGYSKGVKPSGIPKYDVFGMKMLATQCGNTVGKLEGHIPQTEHGVYLPDKEDTAIAIAKLHES